MSPEMAPIRHEYLLGCTDEQAFAIDSNHARVECHGTSRDSCRCRERSRHRPINGRTLQLGGAGERRHFDLDAVSTMADFVESRNHEGGRTIREEMLVNAVKYRKIAKISEINS